jgi:hypothetical protein
MPAEAGGPTARLAVIVGAYWGTASASLYWLIDRLPPGPQRWDALRKKSSSAPILQASQWRFYTMASQCPPHTHRSLQLGDVQGLLEVVVPSELAILGVLNFVLSSLAMAALLTTCVFLPSMSVAEGERMGRRLVKYTVFRVMFLGSTLTAEPRDVALWLGWFALVGFLRVFLGAAKDRLEALTAAPRESLGVGRGGTGGVRCAQLCSVLWRLSTAACVAPSPGAPLGRHVRGAGLLALIMAQNALAVALVGRGGRAVGAPAVSRRGWGRGLDPAPLARPPAARRCSACCAARPCAGCACCWWRWTAAWWRWRAPRRG